MQLLWTKEKGYSIALTFTQRDAHPAICSKMCPKIAKSITISGIVRSFICGPARICPLPIGLLVTELPISPGVPDCLPARGEGRQTN
jgi:hypothetical protein